jgi:hypothetical protein
VASGRAWFFQPGTQTSQVPIYSDGDGLTAQTQPVALDAGGRAVVYLKEAARIEVQDSAGNNYVTIRGEDRGNTLQAAQVEIENLAFTGVDLVNATQVLGGRTTLDAILSAVTTSFGGIDWKYLEGAGTTSRKMRDAIGRWISPTDFGAFGDGATDDTAALQACITRALASDKAIWIEPGTYKITAPLTATGATAAGLYIVGASRSACLIRNHSTTGNALSIDLSSAVESHIVLSNFAISANTTSSGAGIVFVNGDGPKLDHVSVTLHRIGYDTSAVSHASLYDCIVPATDSNAAGKGFRMGSHTTAIKCRVLAAAAGVGFSQETANSRALHCRAVGCATGYSMTAADTVALFSDAGTCTTGFSVGAVARSGGAFLTGSGNTTDFTTNASATDVIDIGNSALTTRTLNEYGGQWYTQPRSHVLRRNRTSSGTGAAAWTPDPRLGDLQVHVHTSTTADAITINNTGTTGLTDGQMMIVVHSNEDTGTATITWGSQYVRTPTAVSGFRYIISHFTWRAATGNWLDVDTNFATGITITGATW